MGNPLNSRWYKGSLVMYPVDTAGVGTIFYVNSNTGDDTNNSGLDWENALATIDTAIGKCTANGGDVIYVHPCHAETVSAASGIDFDVDDITVIGVKRGRSMPTITMAAADATATCEINADNVTIKGLRFVGGYTGGTTVCFDVKTGSDNITIDDCIFTETANTTELLTTITMEDKTDFVTIRNCVFENLCGGDNLAAIITEGDEHDFLLIEDCIFNGDWTNAVIDLDAANIVQPIIRRCVIVNHDATAGDAIDTASGTKAIISDCRIASGKGDAYPLGDTTAAFVIETYGAEANTYGSAATIATGANFGA